MLLGMIQPQTHFKYVNHILSSEDTSLQALAKKYGTPLYVYSTRAFLEPLRALQQELKSIPHTLCFAVKSNSNLNVLSLLAKAGAGADTVSGGELFRANKAGIKSSKTVFSGVGKTEAEITQALKQGQKGVYAINVESAEELELVERVAKKLKKHARVGFRFNPDIDAQTHAHISTGKDENKFGMKREEILEICNNFRKYPWVRISGLSIHIGSQLLHIEPIREAFQAAAHLYETMAQMMPAGLEFIDLGGGLGVQYQNEKTISVQEYAAEIKKIFSLPHFKFHPPHLVLEPGRFLAANAGVLVTEVLFRKNRSKKDFLIVDAGMNDLLRPALYDAAHRVVPVVEKGALTHSVDVVGPICESADTLIKNASLPSALKGGDLVAILSAGAYGFSMSSHYNSKPRAAEVLVDGKKTKLIRKRETYQDLVRGESK